MASSNTFGTFLETIGTLTRSKALQSGAADRTRSELILKLVSILAQRNDELPVEVLAKEAGVPKLWLLEAILQSQSDGLIKIEEENGTSVARLTSFGKALAAA